MSGLGRIVVGPQQLAQLAPRHGPAAAGHQNPQQFASLARLPLRGRNHLAVQATSKRPNARISTKLSDGWMGTPAW